MLIKLPISGDYTDPREITGIEAFLKGGSRGPHVAIYRGKIQKTISTDEPEKIRDEIAQQVLEACAPGKDPPDEDLDDELFGAASNVINSVGGVVHATKDKPAHYLMPVALMDELANVIDLIEMGKEEKV